MYEKIYCQIVNNSISSKKLSDQLYRRIKEIHPVKYIKKIDSKKFYIIPILNKKVLIYLSFPFHIFTFFSISFASIFVLFGRKFKFILFTRGAVVQSKNFFIYFIKFLYWNIYAIISFIVDIELCCSSYYEIFKISSKIYLPNRLKYNLIYDHISSKQYLKVNEDFLNKKNYKSKKINILLASRYSWDKGIDETLTVISKLNKNDLSKIKLTIIGCCLNIQSKYPNLYSLTKFSKFTARKSILLEMQKADIFLAPSLSESYCWTVFEALQIGCKVFVTSSSPWAFVSKSDFIKTISPLLKDVKSNELFKSFKKMKKLPRYQFSYKKLSKLIEVSDINWRYMIKKDLNINKQDI